MGVDSENYSWTVESDLHSNSLRFSFYLRDIDKIPRNHLRLGNDYSLDSLLVQFLSDLLTGFSGKHTGLRPEIQDKKSYRYNGILQWLRMEKATGKTYRSCFGIVNHESNPI